MLATIVCKGLRGDAQRFADLLPKQIRRKGELLCQTLMARYPSQTEENYSDVAFDRIMSLHQGQSIIETYIGGPRPQFNDRGRQKTNTPEKVRRRVVGPVPANGSQGSDFLGRKVKKQSFTTTEMSDVFNRRDRIAGGNANGDPSQQIAKQGVPNPRRNARQGNRKSR
ncbi:hypothetical protein VTN31DRAFT_250 [Thermomyces dupontii]|uniref:uncharacterized protein n=1 Tax=Talaromyces thermophilus TaxID=28565 RepID=UPI00374224CF